MNMSIASLTAHSNIRTPFKTVHFQESFPGVSGNFYDDSDSSDDYDDDGLDAIIREGDLISCDPSLQCDDRTPRIFDSPGSLSIQQLLRWGNKKRERSLNTRYFYFLSASLSVHSFLCLYLVYFVSGPARSSGCPSGAPGLPSWGTELRGSHRGCCISQQLSITRK